MRPSLLDVPPGPAITFFGSSTTGPGVRFLKRSHAMLVSLAVAAAVLASPRPMPVASALPKGAVFLVLGAEESTAMLPPPTAAAAAEPGPAGFLGGWLGQLAVVKPHRSHPGAPPSLQLFVLVAPMKGQVGVHAVGSF